MIVIEGQGIGKTGRIYPTSGAVVFNADRTKVLLTQRSDNGRWALPAGMMEAGENAADCCVREVREETGLDVRITKLVGVYTSGDRVFEYADGNRYHYVFFLFEAEVISGELSLSDETTGVGFYTEDDIAQMDVMPHYLEHIADARVGQTAAFIR